MTTENTLTETPIAPPKPASDRPAGGIERSQQYRSFWRKLDATLGGIEARHSVVETLDQILRTILSDYRQDLHVVAGRLYEKGDQGEYVLRRGLAVFAVLRNVTDTPNDTKIHGPATPLVARFRQRNYYDSLWSFGVRGSF